MGRIKKADPFSESCGKPASRVSFFANLEGGVGFVYLLGRRDKVLTRFRIEQSDRPTKFSFESKSGIRRALISHLGSVIGIDDIEYTVE